MHSSLFAAITELLDGTTCVHQTEETLAKDASLTRIFNDALPHNELLCFVFGSWSKKFVYDMASKFSDVKFIWYSLNVDVTRQDVCTPKGLTIHKMTGGLWHVESLIKCIKEEGLATKIFTALLERSDIRELVNVLERRGPYSGMLPICSYSILFYGLTYFVPLETKSYFTKFRLIFLGASGITLIEIKKCGEAITRVIENFLNTRLKDAYEAAFPDGTTASVVCCQDMTEHAHAMLRERFKSDMTISVSIELDKLAWLPKIKTHFKLWNENAKTKHLPPGQIPARLPIKRASDGDVVEIGQPPAKILKGNDLKSALFSNE
jgi:hypothetical protein